MRGPDSTQPLLLKGYLMESLPPSHLTPSLLKAVGHSVIFGSKKNPHEIYVVLLFEDILLIFQCLGSFYQLDGLLAYLPSFVVDLHESRILGISPD